MHQIHNVGFGRGVLIGDHMTVVRITGGTLLVLLGLRPAGGWPWGPARAFQKLAPPPSRSSLYPRLGDPLICI